MTWDNAVTWADQLSYGGFDDWRLPYTVDGPWSYGSTAGYDITKSEMGYMCNEYLEDPNFISPFNNLQAYYYWSGTESEYAIGSPMAWIFDLTADYQSQINETYELYAWAVRDGDVDAAPVPEPATLLLLGTGLVGLVGYKRKRR